MPLNLANLSVLVVEDNQHMRQLLISVLKSLGIVNAFQAGSGDRALQIIRADKPDIILTDWQMEPMDGLELVRRIRSDAKNPCRLAPIILMTGYSAQARVMRARDTGVTEFLVKPFTATALAKRITHVINMPRDFIAAPAYTGPDRRRKRDDKGAEKRRRASEKASKASP
jgi:two-component system, chemotaxis family, chemotaxis protein CheY